MRHLLIIIVLLSTTPATFASELLINGAGASFPYPLYSKWFSEYAQVDKEVKINYQSIGSGGGIRQFLKGTTDFGASDAPMKDFELKKSDIEILHIPTVLGAVVVSYNLEQLNGDLMLTPELLVKIFSGEIKKWGHADIQEVNPKLKLPVDQHILVAHRSDGSGTTAVFTDYLAKVSPKWKKQYGHGKGIKWPAGIGGKGNEGVTGLLQNNPGSIGYIEMTYAMANEMPMAAIKNKAGEFVKPSVKSISQAAAKVKLPDDYRASITNAEGVDAYPLTAFTYLLIHKKMQSPKGEKLKEFLQWSMKRGQEMATPLHYAPLPESLQARVKKTISKIQIED